MQAFVKRKETEDEESAIIRQDDAFYGWNRRRRRRNPKQLKMPTVCLRFIIELMQRSSSSLLCPEKKSTFTESNELSFLPSSKKDELPVQETRTTHISRTNNSVSVSISSLSLQPASGSIFFPNAFCNFKHTLEV